MLCQLTGPLLNMQGKLRNTDPRQGLGGGVGDLCRRAPPTTEEQDRRLLPQRRQSSEADEKTGVGG